MLPDDRAHRRGHRRRSSRRTRPPRTRCRRANSSRGATASRCPPTSQCSGRARPRRPSRSARSGSPIKLGAEASLAFNESVSLHLRGELDVGALRHARARARRSATTRCARRSAPTARRSTPATARARRAATRSDGSCRIATTELAAIALRHVNEPFDLEHGPLLRAEIVQLAADHHVLVLTGHHIVLDGWSFWVVVRELAALYGIATGARARCAAARTIICRLRDRPARRVAERSRDSLERGWWVEKFQAGVPTLDLPTDRPRASRSHARPAGREDHVLSAELVASTKALGAKLGASLFATLLAAFDALLHRLSGATDPRHRRAGGRPGVGRARRAGRPLREHVAAAQPGRAHRYVSRARARVAPHDARRVRSRRRHVRARAADVAAGARSEPAADDQRRVQHRPGALRRGQQHARRRARARVEPAHARDVRAVRQRRRHRRRDAARVPVQLRPVRRRDDQTLARRVRGDAARGGRRSRPDDRQAAAAARATIGASWRSGTAPSSSIRARGASRS